MYYFKNFDKLISAKTLNNPTNNFFVRFRNSLFNPVYYYLGKPITESDPFSLSLVAYHLHTIKERDQILLAHINESLSIKSDKPLETFKSRIEFDLNSNNQTLQTYTSELKRVLRLSVYDVPVESAIKSLYVLENSGEKDLEFYTSSIIPIIKTKIGYASYRNLQDLTVSLVKLKYYEDKELWNLLGQALEAKTSQGKPQSVEYSGWTLDTYETSEEKKHSYLTNNEYYFASLNKKGGRYSAGLKSYIRSIYNVVRSRLVYRVFFQERRIISLTERFDDEKIDYKLLIDNLKEAKKEVKDGSIDKILQNIAI